MYELMNEVKKFPGVIEISRVFGIYNIVTSLSVKGKDDKKGLIF